MTLLITQQVQVVSCDWWHVSYSPLCLHACERGTLQTNDSHKESLMRIYLCDSNFHVLLHRIFFVNSLLMWFLYCQLTWCLRPRTPMLRVPLSLSHPSWYDGWACCGFTTQTTTQQKPHNTNNSQQCHKKQFYRPLLLIIEHCPCRLYHNITDRNINHELLRTSLPNATPRTWFQLWKRPPATPFAGLFWLWQVQQHVFF